MPTMSLITSMDVYMIRITLAIIIGTLMAIVYCLRVLVSMERRLEKIELHTEHMVAKVLGRSLREKKK